MAQVTIKDLDDQHLSAVAKRAEAAGMSTQEYLRRMIAREAAQPFTPDELGELLAAVRAKRTPLSMAAFERARRRSFSR